MRPLITDPTAGRRARDINLFPEVARPIMDPTDPRCGAPAVAPQPGVYIGRRVVDPTDPRVARV